MNFLIQSDSPLLPSWSGLIFNEYLDWHKVFCGYLWQILVPTSPVPPGNDSTIPPTALSCSVSLNVGKKICCRAFLRSFHLPLFFKRHGCALLFSLNFCLREDRPCLLWIHAARWTWIWILMPVSTVLFDRYVDHGQDSANQLSGKNLIGKDGLCPDFLVVPLQLSRWETFFHYPIPLRTNF